MFLVLLLSLLQDVVEAQLAAGELPAETASALRRMRAELQAADARQKVGRDAASVCCCAAVCCCCAAVCCCCGCRHQEHVVVTACSVLALCGSELSCP